MPTPPTNTRNGQPAAVDAIAASHIQEELNLGPMNVTCDDCDALYWIDERVTTSPANKPVFEAAASEVP